MNVISFIICKIVLNMSHSGSSQAKEKIVLEPEVSCEDQVVKRSHSGRELDEAKLRQIST